MSDANLYGEVYGKALSELKDLDFSTDDATVYVKNLKILSECTPFIPVPDAPIPNTVWEKVTSKLDGLWDNETTRVLIKAGGAFAGVALVTWTTVHRDHVFTREALSQANQRNS